MKPSQASTSSRCTTIPHSASGTLFWSAMSLTWISMLSGGNLMAPHGCISPVGTNLQPKLIPKRIGTTFPKNLVANMFCLQPKAKEQCKNCFFALLFVYIVVKYCWNVKLKYENKNRRIYGTKRINFNTRFWRTI